MKLLKLLPVLLFFSFAANAQVKTNPFRAIPKPTFKVQMLDKIGETVNTTFTAWRFTPMTGYNLSTKQLMAGIGYGIQWMHFVDSTQKYYTTFSVKATGWVNGLTAPSINPPNIASFGVSVGILNELIQIGAAYTPPTSESKGMVGPVINFAIPLNN